MKKISYVIFLWICLLLVPVVMAATNPYPKTKNWYGEIKSNCTYTAWQAAYDTLGVALPGWGNANTWLSSAAKAGYSIGNKPRKNSIVVFDDGGYGHVAFVSEYYEDEEAYTLAGEGTFEIYRYEINGYYTLGYIYLDEAPKQSNSSSNNSSNSNNANSTTNNNSSNKTSSASSALKSLEIENYDLDFKKDVFTYVIEVSQDVEKINIKATAQDSKAKIENTGEKELKVGDNYIAIKVTSTDKTVSNYNIIVTRLAKEEEEEQGEVTQDENENNTEGDANNKDEEAKKNKKNELINKLLIVGIVSPIILIIFILSFILFKKKRVVRDGEKGKIEKGNSKGKEK